MSKNEIHNKYRVYSTMETITVILTSYSLHETQFVTHPTGCFEHSLDLVGCGGSEVELSSYSILDSCFDATVFKRNKLYTVCA